MKAVNNGYKQPDKKVAFDSQESSISNDPVDFEEPEEPPKLEHDTLQQSKLEKVRIRKQVKMKVVEKHRESSTSVRRLKTSVNKRSNSRANSSTSVVKDF